MRHRFGLNNDWPLWTLAIAYVAILVLMMR